MKQLLWEDLKDGMIVKDCDGWILKVVETDDFVNLEILDLGNRHHTIWRVGDYIEAYNQDNIDDLELQIVNGYNTPLFKTLRGETTDKPKLTPPKIFATLNAGVLEEKK